MHGISGYNGRVCVPVNLLMSLNVHGLSSWVFLLVKLHVRKHAICFTVLGTLVSFTYLMQNLTRANKNLRIMYSRSDLTEISEKEICVV